MEAIDSVKEHPKRPVFLLVLCILSFVWIGLGVVQGGIGLVHGPDSQEQVERATKDLDKEVKKLEDQGITEWTPTFEKMKNMVVVMNNNFYTAVSLAFLIYIIGTAAVVLMFRGRKLGFHLYVIYSLLSICDYYFFISPAMVPTVVIVLSAIAGALFIGLYALNLKWMR
jgi:ABC-type proline/glycine betaine transport system permease subunit